MTKKRRNTSAPACDRQPPITALFKKQGCAVAQETISSPGDQLTAARPLQQVESAKKPRLDEPSAETLDHKPNSGEVDQKSNACEPSEQPNLLQNNPDNPDHFEDDAKHHGPPLCKEQQDLLRLIAEGQNVFYTGSAGCGKSTVLKAAVRMLRKQGKKVQVVAPTGQASLEVDGMTTWAYMGWTPLTERESIHKLFAKKVWRKTTRQRLLSTDVLIIDEISMVGNFHLERMNLCMKILKAWDAWRYKLRDLPFPKCLELPSRAFGGIQVIITGDFCQLPPVKALEFCKFCGAKMESDECQTLFTCPEGHGSYPKQDQWAFKSPAWEEANFVHVHLNEIHRQSDQSFVRMLQKIRLGIHISPQDIRVLSSLPCRNSKATQLLCYRADVESVNESRYDALKTLPDCQYKALDGFEKQDKLPDELTEWCTIKDENGHLDACKDMRLERFVKLRPGMPVVLLANLDMDAGLVNGSQGILSGFVPASNANLPDFGASDSFPKHKFIFGEHKRFVKAQLEKFVGKMQKDGSIMNWPLVRFYYKGVLQPPIVVYPRCIVEPVGTKEPYSLLHRTQIPLAAGWATTVHKSQGLTMRQAIVDLSGAFESGQVYVALSRVTALEGLHIKGLPNSLSDHGASEEVMVFLREKFGNELEESIRNALVEEDSAVHNGVEETDGKPVVYQLGI